MPTEKGRKSATLAAAAVLKRHRSDLIKKWTTFFPRARWSRKEARQISALTFDAIVGYLERGKTEPLLDAMQSILALAARKDAALSSGLARMAAAKASILEILLSSTEIDRNRLKRAVLRVNRLFDEFSGVAVGSALRSTSATEELLRRVSFHEGILKNPSLAVFAADQKGKVVLWSSGVENLTGIPQGVVRGKRLPRALTKVEFGSTQELPNTEALAAFSALAKRLGLPPVKRPRHLITSISRVVDDADVFLGTVGIASDVTSIVATQERLEELAEIIDNSWDTIVQIAPDGKVVSWNKGAERLTGFSKKEALGKEGTLFVKWKSPADYSRMLSSLRRDGRWKDELTAVRKNGTEYRVIASATALYSSSGDHTGSLIVGTDITELREAQSRIEEQARLLDQTHEAIVQTDAEGRIIFWNKGAEVLTGYGSNEALGKQSVFFRQVSPDYDRDKMLEVFKRQSVFTRELRLVKKNGEQFTALVSHSPIRSSEGAYLGAIAVATDMSERIKTEKESRLLLDLSSALGKYLELKEIAPEALAKTMEVLEADAGLVALVGAGSGSLDFIAHRGIESAVIARLRNRMPGEGWTGKVMKTGKPLIIENISKSRYGPLAYPETVRGGYVSFVSFPLMFHNQVFGVIEMASRRAGQFKPSDLEFVKSVASVLSSALYNAKLHSELEAGQRELTELSQRLATVEEDERRRIAAELHDETGQLLAAAKANMQMTLKQLGRASDSARKRIEETTNLIARSLDQVRDVSHGLHPPLLDDVGLAAAVKWLAQNARETSNIMVRVRTRGMGERLSPAVEASIFRIIQEVLNNAVRHSRATAVKVDLTRTDSKIRVSIQDDGIGFDTIKQLRRPKGLGIRTLRQRVHWLGGQIRLKSTRGKGTLVEIEIPTEEYENEKHQSLSG